MNATILCPLVEPQIEALIEWHHHEAQHANLMQDKSDHLRDAADLRDATDLRRRLIDAQERTEDHT